MFAQETNMQKIVGVNDQGRWIGQDHQHAKLTDAECELVRQMHAEGMTYKKLAEKFGVSKSSICGIVTFRRRGQCVAAWRTVQVKD